MGKILRLTRPLLRVRVEYEEGIIRASMDRASYLPVTSFRTLNEVLEVEDVHAIDTGRYDEWTRYYREQSGYDVEVWSGICYHLENGGRKFDLAEYLNQRRRGQQTPEIWLRPEPDNEGAFDEALFYDTLVKVLTAIYKGNEAEVPDLSRLVG